MSPAAQQDALIDHWKTNPHATYRTGFLWEERLKNFRSIRRGIGQIVREIEGGSFRNVYRGSTLETDVSSIAEQRQIFKGADHAFLGKPKLRIPDIYENEDNPRAFGRLLQAYDCCDTADAVIDAIRWLDAQQVKGLGPAVANLLYFIHPTLVVPFSTAIVRGYNALTGSNVKLGRWDHSLSMREGVMRLKSVRLIDVVWLEAGRRRVAAVFEVEHSTSIYSGIVRMLDLTLGSAVAAGTAMFLVAPEDRRDEVAQQLRRSAVSRESELGIRFLPYGELRTHRAAIGRFGAGLRPLLEISQAL
jgi:hypothetical protein